MNAQGSHGKLKLAAALRVVNDSAYASATVLQTSQQFNKLQKVVDDAMRERRNADADVLRNIRQRRDKYVMECSPPALNFVREVQSFSIHIENKITVITQSLQDPNFD